MAFDLVDIGRRLHAMRAALIADDELAASDRAPVALDQESVGRLSRIDAVQVQAMALAQSRRRQTSRARIEAAVQRIDDGEFGYCVRCGDAIAEARVDHDPSVATCIQCARED